MRMSQPEPRGQANTAPWRRWLLPAAVTAIFVTVLVRFGGASRGMPLTYTQFLADLGAGSVRAVTIGPAGQVTGSLAGGQPFTTTIPVALGGNGLAGDLAAHHVQVTATAAATSPSLLSVLAGLLPLLLIGGLLYAGLRTARRQAGGLGGVGSLTKAKARVIDAERPATRFADVAGYPAVKTEIGEIVDYLRDPARYHRAGARGPRGVLMAGPELATAFAFRRFTRQGADAHLAGWSLLAGGMISSAAAALVAAGAGLASGKILVAVVAVTGGMLAVAVLAGVAAAARRPGLRRALERGAARIPRHAGRLVGRPAGDPVSTIQAWAERLGSLQLPAPGWMWVTGLALAATGLRASQALAAVLLYRLASFWLVAGAGWLILLWLRRPPRARRGPASTRTAPLAGHPAGRPGRRPVSAPHPARQVTLPSAPGPGPETAARADSRRPTREGAHELVLLHGQPGSAADWQQVATRLPASFHAVAADRPGYGSSPRPAGGFAANARAVLDDLDARGVQRAVLVGHSYGGGVALSAASLAPQRVEAVILLASVGPGCVNGWDRLLAAPGAGPLCALVAWRLTPWIARARLAHIARRRRHPLQADEHVNWQVWGHVGPERRPLWRTFLTEQRALLRELSDLEGVAASVRAPVLLLADPNDPLVPVDTALRLARTLPEARLQLVEGAGHHLPRRIPDVVVDAITAFLNSPPADATCAGMVAN
jgi:pimeloyl-ACP methyl ester carboxylesterase